MVTYKGGITMNVLRTENLKKYYGDDDNLVRALDGVDLEVERGEFVAVVGTSGSGKSTLLHMLGGLDRPTEGRVFVDGKDISELKDDALCVFRRRKIGFVFQSYNLVPVLNVYENIVLPIELDGNTVDKNYVRKVIEILGLTDRVHRLPSQLSGGQQQRVAIARALSAKPAILLADEPTGSVKLVQHYLKSNFNNVKIVIYQNFLKYRSPKRPFTFTWHFFIHFHKTILHHSINTGKIWRCLFLWFWKIFQSGRVNFIILFVFRYVDQIIHI